MPIGAFTKRRLGYLATNMPARVPTLLDLPTPPPGRTGWPWDVSSDLSPQLCRGQLWPRISIVTPSFNQGHFIEETIRSVLLQGYPNLEFIVIDGGSKDGTVEILRKYSAWIDFWVSEPDGGQSDAINKGLARCSGNIFNWLNSDDYLAKGALSRVAESFQSSPTATLVSGELRIFGSGADRIHICNKPQTRVEGIVRSGFWQPSVFWRINALRPLLPLEQHIHYYMDFDLYTRHFLANGVDGVAYINDLLAHFREHRGSKSQSQQESFTADMIGYVKAIARESSLDTIVACANKFGCKALHEDFRVRGEWSALKKQELYDILFGLLLPPIVNLRSAADYKRWLAVVAMRKIDPEAKRLIDSHPHLVKAARYRSWFLYRFVKRLRHGC